MTNEEMFEKNIRIAYKIANKYLINYKQEYEDIKQIALLGLWKAVLSFDNIHAFSTYAYAVVTNEINYYLRNNKKHKNNISINAEIGENITIADTLKDDENHLEKIENKAELELLQQIIKKQTNKFREKDLKVFNLMLQGKKQNEIAKELKVSQPQVSRIERKIKTELNKIRSNL